jgi:hypothetical protein
VDGYQLARPNKVREIHSAPCPESVDVSRRGCIGIFGNEAGDHDLVRLPYEAVLDATSVGVPDRLDPALRPDGDQLLEALGPNIAIRDSYQSDDLVPGAIRPQRAVVAGVLRLARHPHGSDYNSCAAIRYRRDDHHGGARRSRRCLALGAVPDLGSLRDYGQRRRCGHELGVELREVSGRWALDTEDFSQLNEVNDPDLRLHASEWSNFDRSSTLQPRTLQHEFA